MMVHDRPRVTGASGVRARRLPGRYAPGVRDHRRSRPAGPGRHRRSSRTPPERHRPLGRDSSESEHNRGIDVGETSKQYLHRPREHGSRSSTAQSCVRLMKNSGSPEPLPGHLDAAVARPGRRWDGRPAVRVGRAATRLPVPPRTGPGTGGSGPADGLRYGPVARHRTEARPHAPATHLTPPHRTPARHRAPHPHPVPRPRANPLPGGAR